MRRLLTIILLVFAYVVLAPIAHAQSKCGPRDALAKSFAGQFQEVHAARGQIDDQHIMELFISPEGSWTIIATNTDKMSCIVMGGTEGFEFVAPEVPKPGQGT